MAQEELHRQTILTQAGLKAQPFPASPRSTGCTQAQASLLQSSLGARTGRSDGHTGCLQTNLTLIFKSYRKQPSCGICNPARVAAESYCMEQPSVGRRSYTYMATDLDR